jgi:hypothetical protein
MTGCALGDRALIYDNPVVEPQLAPREQDGVVVLDRSAWADIRRAGRIGE